MTKHSSRGSLNCIKSPRGACPQGPFQFDLVSFTRIRRRRLQSVASLVAHVVKNPPTMPKTCVQSLGREDPLEEGTAIHSSILAWEIPWTEEPGGLQSVGSQSVGHG